VAPNVLREAVVELAAARVAAVLIAEPAAIKV